MKSAQTNTIEILPLSEEDARTAKLLTDQDEKIVYEHIRASHTKGIWMKDLITNTNMHRQVITKAIKSLENKEIIKSVKSIKTPAKKIYMLTNVVPSVEITGGAWFTDQELDVEFIEMLAKATMKFMLHRFTQHQVQMYGTSVMPVSSIQGLPSADDVKAFIARAQLTSVDLARQDVEDLLQMMVYDGQLEKWKRTDFHQGQNAKSIWVYRPTLKALRLHAQASRDHNQGTSDIEDPCQMRMEHWSSMPCAHCPVFEECSDHGRVTPAKCEYFHTWLGKIEASEK